MAEKRTHFDLYGFVAIGDAEYKKLSTGVLQRLAILDVLIPSVDRYTAAVQRVHLAWRLWPLVGQGEPPSPEAFEALRRARNNLHRARSGLLGHAVELLGAHGAPLIRDSSLDPWLWADLLAVELDLPVERVRAAVELLARRGGHNG